MTARVAVAGATGRMGRMLVQALLECDDLVLSGALTQAGSIQLGSDAAAFLGKVAHVALTADLVQAVEGAQLLIDFSTPEATRNNLAECVKRRIPMVIGTTGIDDAGRKAIVSAGASIGIVFAPNMSIGANVALALVALAARALPEAYDAEILEVHHRLKRDAPSGTALQLGEVIANSRGGSLTDRAQMPRHGLGLRRDRSIGIASLRGGDVIGDHTVLFAGPGERVEITHRSTSRMTYAEGSLCAARFLLQHPAAGVFDMRAVLGLDTL
jgi:4-hydroxy-tetrahydrodipicolinate reductase